MSCYSAATPFAKLFSRGCVLEFCLCKINSEVAIDWQLPFFFFLMTFSLLCCRLRLTGTARQPRLYQLISKESNLNHVSLDIRFKWHNS